MISRYDARIMDFDHGGYDGNQIHDFMGKTMISYYVQICDEQKRLTAYSSGNVGIGSRAAEPRTVVYIESAMREHKESFFNTLHGAHAVDGTRRAKVVGAAAPPL